MERLRGLAREALPGLFLRVALPRNNYMHYQTHVFMASKESVIEPMTWKCED